MGGSTCKLLKPLGTHVETGVFVTWDVEDGAASEVAGKQIGIKCSTHEYDLKVRPTGQQVAEYHHKKVTETKLHVVKRVDYKLYDDVSLECATL